MVFTLVWNEKTVLAENTCAVIYIVHPEKGVLLSDRRHLVFIGNIWLSQMHPIRSSYNMPFMCGANIIGCDEIYVDGLRM